MAFVRIKRNRKTGKIYRSLEERYRENGRVRSRYIRSLSNDKFERSQDRAMALAERAAAKIDAYQRAHFGETGAERAAREAEAAKFSQSEFLAETQAPAADTGIQGNAGHENAAGEPGGDKGEGR
jgi:hypothetical protein